jgi:carbonic anhydrase
MATLEILKQRNAEFAAHRFADGLMMMPSLKTIIIGCVDPRVDPALILGIDLGEVAVIRNIGGRITAATLQELALLRKLTQARGSDLDQAWNLIILQHTDCGIVRLQNQPEMLADYLNISPDALAEHKIAAPPAAVELDIAVLRAAAVLPRQLQISGFVYDVTTGQIQTVVAPSIQLPPKS